MHAAGVDGFLRKHRASSIVAAEQRQVDSLGGVRERDGAPDSPAGARNESNAVLQSEFHGISRSDRFRRTIIDDAALRGKATAQVSARRTHSAASSRRSSASWRPTSCRPNGNPLFACPQGIVMQGR